VGQRLGPLAAAQHGGALFNRSGHDGLHTLPLTLGRHRAQVHPLEPTAQPQRSSFDDQALDELVENVIVHIEPLGRGAHLSTVEEGRKGRTTGHHVDGSRRHHDERIVA
jgi:hypothetical protein